MTPFAPPESCTDMRECRHWKKNCHKCLIPELVKALENLVLYSASGDWVPYQHWTLRDARALIEKAKLVEECEG